MENPAGHLELQGNSIVNHDGRVIATVHDYKNWDMKKVANYFVQSANNFQDLLFFCMEVLEPIREHAEQYGDQKYYDLVDNFEKAISAAKKKN